MSKLLFIYHLGCVRPIILRHNGEVYKEVLNIIKGSPLIVN